MKCKFLLSIAAVLIPMSLPAVLSAQVASIPADAIPTLERYEVYAGFAYSGANQVKGSSALYGFNIGGEAKLKKWFGANVDFGQYQSSTGVAKPTVTTFLAGPEFYIPSGNLTGIGHVLFGGSHTGNVGATPDIAFTYAVGGGFEYKVGRRFSVRVTGDDILAATVIDPTNQGYSQHTHANPRASFGIAYRF